MSKKEKFLFKKWAYLSLGCLLQAIYAVGGFPEVCNIFPADIQAYFRADPSARVQIVESIRARGGGFSNAEIEGKLRGLVGSLPPRIDGVPNSLENLLARVDLRRPVTIRTPKGRTVTGYLSVRENGELFDLDGKILVSSQPASNAENAAFFNTLSKEDLAKSWISFETYRLESGATLGLSGDAQFISFPNGLGGRDSGRVARIWREPSGQVHVMVDVIDPTTRSISRRELLGREVDGSNVSATSKRNFALLEGQNGRLGAEPAVELGRSPEIRAVDGAQQASARISAPQGEMPFPLVRQNRGPVVISKERQSWVQDIFKNSPTVKMDAGMLRKNLVRDPGSGTEYIMIHSASDVRYSEGAGRVFRNTSVSNLPKGFRYNYVVTRDGEVVFGQVFDDFEFGVKHMHLAQNRNIVAAGEIALAEDGSMRWNLMSGTFTQPLVRPDRMGKVATDMETLRIRMQEVFRADVPTLSRVEYTQSSLGVNRIPTLDEFRRLCAPHSPFIVFNSKNCPPAAFSH